MATQSVTKAHEPAPIEIAQTIKPDTTITGTPDHDTAIAPVKPVESSHEDETPRTQPSASAVPTPTAPTQEAQSVRWDLTMADMARVLNIADNQNRCFDELQILTMELGPLPAPQETIEDLIVGPPVASVDEVVLVLAADETLDDPLAAVETPVPAFAPAHRQGTQMLDDMEISLQILRNEIQCQKESGWGATEKPHQPLFEQMIPVNDNPATPQTLDPNQRTQLWQSEFSALDNLLAIVRNETVCAQDSAVAQFRPEAQGHQRASDQFAQPPYYGDAFSAPPATTPRRAR
jgi:hypothetical protein